MMPQAEQYPCVVMDPALGSASLQPYLPITLAHVQATAPVMGLLDTAAMVNVLPHRVGLQLGAVWEEQTTSVKLTGNLANFDARVLVLIGRVGHFLPVRLAFAWTQSDEVPVILGQVNFFLEFDACFFRSKSPFEVKPKQSP